MLFGQYKLLQKVGQGGMAEIWLASRTGVEGFEKPVAVKKILDKHCAKEKFVRMFISEAKLCSRLTHRNIVQIHELGAIDSEYFIAMEYVDGWDLLRVLHRCARTRRPLPAALAMYVVAEICRGLDHAHKAKGPGGEPLNIVHFDVSPSNILINTDGAVKVSDFGVARAAMGLGEGTASDRFRGKIAYMSPEQLENRAVDHRSDIFSAGIVLYEALTLKRLFRARTDEKTLENVREADVEPRLARHPEIPNIIKNVLRRMLARSAEDRFATAGDVAEALDTFLFDNRVRVTSRDVANFMGELFAGTNLGTARPSTTRGTWRTTDRSSPTGRSFPLASETGLLDGITFGEVLARLGVQGATGLLLATHSPVRKEIYLVRGRIVHTNSNLADESLGPFLERKGTITHEQLAQANALAEQRGLSTESALFQLGLVDWTALPPLILEQAEAQVLELYTWKSGHYSFHPGQEPPPGALRLELDPLGIVARGVHATQTTETIAAFFTRLGNPMLPRAVPPPFPVEKLKLSPRELRLVQLIRTTTDTVRGILREHSKTHAERAALLKVVFLLHQTGHLVIKSPAKEAHKR